jgi:hypothetical protein
MTEPRCPHCQTVLPEKATFCAACGNRIEGWSVVPVAAQPPTSPSGLPGGDEPTTNMQPTPSLLRVAALSKPRPAKQKQPEKPPAREKPTQKTADEIAAVKEKPFVRWALLGGVALLAAALAFELASRPREQLPPVTVAPRPSPVAPVAVAAPSGATQKRAHRIEPLQVATPRRDRGGVLPHKAVTTDSKALAVKPNPEAARVALEPKADAPEEAAPLTDEEMKKQAEASIDADGVRFVVKSHLSQVHACYERSFKESSPGGRVEIGFAIGSDGNPKRIRTESNSTGSDSLASCLEGRVKSWQFPKPVGGDYELIYPFVFAPGS